MFQNNNSDYHILLCLITQGVENGEKLSGLAHVGEHTCILPFSDDLDYRSNIIHTSGYTCTDHACLYFVSRNYEELFYIKDKICNKSVIRQDRIDIAKHQVICELRDLRKQFDISESIVRFVTDDRIHYFASGQENDIQKIKADDVSNWLNEIHTNNKFIPVLLELYNCKYPENLISKLNRKEKKIANESTGEEILCINSDLKEKVVIYLRKPGVYSKIEYLRWLMEESFFQHLLEIKLDKKVSVYEKFFSYNERYLVIEIENRNIEFYIESIRKINLTSKNDYMIFKEKFYELHKQSSSKCKESYLDVISKIQNHFFYDLPYFNLPDDLGLIEKMGTEFSDDFKALLKKKYKVVVFNTNERVIENAN